MSFKMESIVAFVSVDPASGEEGLIAFYGPDGVMMPMIASDEKRLRYLKPTADAISARTGIPYRCLRFSVRTDITEQIQAQFPAPAAGDLSSN
jgi:hypothetical protein